MPPITTSFTVIVNRETLTFDSMTTPVLMWEEKGDTIAVLARPRDMNVQIYFSASTGQGTWTLSGVPGQASGEVAFNK